MKIEGTPVYLDVEGLPDRDFYYLIGVRIGNGESAVQHSLWADTLEDEEKIWREFLGILETVQKPVLIHYGSYEISFLRRMTQDYGRPAQGSAAANAITSSINMLSAIYAHVYFPTFSNGLKEVARHLGFNWSEAGASGLTSIVWRQHWEGSRSGLLLQCLINYNAEDCEALSRLQKWFVEIASQSRGAKVNGSADVVHADSLPRDFPSVFKVNQFQFAEFEQINKAAYWDYQREKILVRSSERLKRVVRNACKRSRKKPRANKIVDCPEPTVCLNCGGITLYRHQAASKTVIDVRFGQASVKKWTIMYRFCYYRCPRCKAVFHSPERACGPGKFGPNLRALYVYQIIDLRLPQHQVAACLNLLLGLQLSCTMVNKFKEGAATFYQATHAALLKSIVSGTLVHADETTVSLDGRAGYVWVFTNLEEVVYLYAPSREGDLVQQVLKDFKGVLVSDFYAAYDSLNCAQQKCLIHLIRDLNENLFKEPFNTEFKELVGEVAALLKPMVETVDRFGLKARFLRRHIKDADRFFKRLSCREFVSEAGMKCKQRLEKNRDTLFTFLDHDGIPWNNNNAEHAVKALALLRRVFAGVTTEKGIKEYLILLSVRETCKYMGVGFLDFLRSGEKDIHAFAESRRGRRRRTQSPSGLTTSSPDAPG